MAARARDLAGRIPETRLVAVADTAGGLAKEIAEEFDVPRAYTEPNALIDSVAADLVHDHRRALSESCGIAYPSNSTVQLIAAPNGESTFTG